MSFTLPEPADIRELLNTPVNKDNVDAWIREWLRIDPDKVAQREIYNKLKQLNIAYYSAEIIVLLNTPINKDNFDAWFREWLRIDPDRVAERDIRKKIKQLNVPNYDDTMFDDWIRWIRAQRLQLSLRL
jgi:hypothetical protein